MIEIVDTDSYSATIRIMPPMAFRLAQACEVAAAGVSGDRPTWLATMEPQRHDLELLWETLAAFFEALGTASAASVHMPQRGEEPFTHQRTKREQLREAGEPPQEQNERPAAD